MRKALILFFILLVVMPTLTHAQSAKDALMGLKKLQARTQAGTNYRDYGNALAEAKFPLNLYFESSDAGKYPELSTSLRNAMKHYENAERVWATKIRSPRYGAGFSANDDFGRMVSQLYPDVNKDKESGGASYILGGKMPMYAVDSVLPIIWKEASKEVNTATKEYAKLEEKSSDETATLKSDDTATLKKEIAELKEEVERLKKENDSLKNPQKVK
jgi:hypothetical protein